LSAIASGWTHAENPVTRLERKSLRADRLHLSGEIQTEDNAFWPPKPVEEPHEEGISPKLATISTVDGRCMDPDQHLVGCGHRFWRIDYLHYVR
jgi:hypothetical protein